MADPYVDATPELLAKLGIPTGGGFNSSDWSWDATNRKLVNKYNGGSYDYSYTSNGGDPSMGTDVYSDQGRTHFNPGEQPFFGFPDGGQTFVSSDPEEIARYQHNARTRDLQGIAKVAALVGGGAAAGGSSWSTGAASGAGVSAPTAGGLSPGAGVLAAPQTAGSALAAGAPVGPTLFAGTGLSGTAPVAGAALPAGGGVLAPAGAAPASQGGMSVFDKIRQFSNIPSGGGGGGSQQPQSRRFVSPAPTTTLAPRQQGPIMPSSSTNYAQLAADAQRRRAFADALLAQSMQTRGPSLQGQRIVPKMSGVEGLAQLGEALLARRAGKQATSLTAQAEEKKRQAQASALRGFNTPPNMVQTPEAQNPFVNAQAGLDAGLDPNVVSEYMRSQRPDTSGSTPADIQGYKFAQQQGYEGSFTDYLKQFHGREQNVPAALQIWEIYKKLSPEDQARFVESQRNVPIEDVNQVPTRVLAGGQQQPLSTLPSEADAARTVKAAEATGSTTGTAQGTAIANLPLVFSTGMQALQTAQQLLNHPGRETATGLSGVIDPRNYIPGTAAKDFEVLRKQALGQVFLDAYQALKGGGPITDIEGKKAEEAKARMDRAQSDAEFERALREYMDAIKRGLNLAAQKAGNAGNPAPIQQPAQMPQIQPQAQQPSIVHWNDLK